MGASRRWVGLTVVALCLAACGNGNADRASGPSTGLDPQDAIAKVLASLGDSTVRSAKIVTDTNEPDCTSPCMRVRVIDAGDDGVKGTWLAELMVGAVGELIRTDETDLGRVISGEITVRKSNGRMHTALLPGAGSTVGVRFDSPSDSALRQRAEAVAARHGLTLRSVEVLHPLQSALAVTFLVPPGHASWTIDQLTNELQGSPTDIEGLLVRLDSPTGQPLLSDAHSERIGGGTGWFGPGQADRFAVQIG